ncbi:acyloxyacyl hydrolase [Agarivorans aestuarii]|uniref:acyloxyacyl hydrolase n=1 Tax=Agarivorans aestuarii TaxID=1563703 RepID=UPI001C825874|nr:acyloxyacyl hydrolase [Agarivorans aestuarii]
MQQVALLSPSKAKGQKLTTSLAWLCLMLLSVELPAKQLNIGVGYGPQVGANVDRQNNAVFDLSYTFWDRRFGENERWQLLLGVGYSHLVSDVEQNSEVDVYSILPTIRYNLKARDSFDPYFGFTAGPSIMSSNKLGYQEQGSRFLFNDFISFGAYFGENRQWELSFSWRHLSNADLLPPNPGFDVPFSLSLGRKF